jgi:ABC-type multidrug transport system fused ATPase/permease subunit
MIKTIKNIIYLSNIKNTFIFLNILGVLILAVLEIISFGSIYPFLDFAINENNSLYLLDLNKFNYQNKLLLLLIIIFIGFFIKNIFIIIFSYWQKKKLYLKQWELTNLLFKKYLDNNTILNKHTSEIQTNIGLTYNVPLWVMNVFNIFSELILLIAIIILLLVVNFKATIVILLICVSILFFFNFFLKKKFIGWSKKSVLSLANSTKSQIESFSGLREITVLGIKDFFYNKFNKNTFGLSNTMFKANFSEQLPRIVLELVFIFIILLVIFYLTEQAKSFEKIIPVLALYFVISVRLVPLFGKIIVNINSLSFAKTMVERLMEIKTLKIKVYKDKKKIKIFKYINFKNVNFSYKKNEKSLKINLKLNNNKFYGLIGKSGSGKTTFSNLLLGLINPNSGKIFIDKTDLNNCKDSWRNIVGLVSQEVFIINDTLSKNIVLGSENDEINKEKILHSLKHAELKEFINNDKIIDFVLAENGKNISAGQRQRIGIARALYRDPQVIIFDEPTSSLDSLTSKNFIKTLNKIKKNKLVIMCTHDLKNLKTSDKIIEISSNSANFVA